MIDLKNEDLKEILKEGIVVVDFYATWCGPCKILSPIIDELSSEMSEVKFVKIDIDKHEEICREYKVMSVPTILVYENGRETKRSIGFIYKEELRDFIR